MRATSDTASSPAIRSLIPARIDRLPWSRFHTRMVTALGVAWILDGLEITIASNVGPDLTLKSTLNMSAGAVADIATWYLIAFLPARGPLQRLDRPGLIDVDNRVELVRQAGPEVVAAPLGFGPVDHADRPLQPPRAQRVGRPRGGVEAEQELLLAHLVQQLLDAVRERGPHPLALGRAFPVAGCRHRAGVGGETDETAVAGVPFADELGEVELAPRGGLRGPGVTEVGVVRPHHDLRGCAPLPAQVAGERVQGVGHVPIAQVP